MSTLLNAGALFFVVAVTDAVKRLDRGEITIGGAHLFAQAFDVTVDGAVVHVDLLVVGYVHQLIALFHKPGALCQGLQQQKLGHSERDIIALPRDRMAQRVHAQLTAHHDFGFFGLGNLNPVKRILPAQ